MNSVWLSLVAVLIFFVDFGFTDLSQPAFHAHRPANPNFDRESVRANESQFALIETVRKFESAISLNNPVVLTHVKSHAQEHEQNLTKILEQVEADVENMDPYEFKDKLWCELIRFEAEAYKRAYKQILQEIVGTEQKVTQFARYIHLDSIAILETQIVDKMGHIWKLLSATNWLVLDGYSQRTNSSVFGKTNKQVFTKHFEEIQQNAAKSRNEIANEYYLELEQTRLKQQTLSITQQTRLELELEVFDYIGQFVKEFEQKFFKLN